MKKVVIAGLLFCFGIGNAQTTIVEDKLTSANKSLNFLAIKEKDALLMMYGKIHGTVRGINFVDEYSINQPKKTIIENEKFWYYRKSSVDNTYCGIGFTNVGWLSDAKFYTDGKQIATLPKKVYEGDFSRDFSKEYIFSLGDEKGDGDVDLLKEDLYLKRISISNQKTDFIKLDKSFLIPLKEEEFDKRKELHYNPYFKTDHFEIVTKALRKDRKSLMIFRTLYDYNGKFIENIVLDAEVGLPIVGSVVGGGDGLGPMKVTTGVSRFEESEFLTNTIKDQSDNSSYLYGLYGKKDGRLINNEVAGFFIIKYDEKGKVIWKKTQEIVDKDVNENGAKTQINITLYLDKNSVSIVIFKHMYDQYFYSAELDKNNGTFIKDKKLTFKVDSMGVAEFYSTPVLSFFKLETLKNIRFDIFGLYLYETNQKIKTYIDNLNNSKNKIAVNFYRTKSGHWLVESDNDNYYKVTFFANE